MKASFYFVLWIIVYPLLWLIPSSFVQQYSFFVALALVWGISSLLNKTFVDTFTYARAVQVLPVMEEVYTGNIGAFSKRLTRDVVIAVVTSLYFCVATAIIVVSVLSHSAGWFELFIFGVLTLAVLSNSVRLFNAWRKLKASPTQLTCTDILIDVMHLDYVTYSTSRVNAPYEALFPPRPRHYSVYIVSSVIFAVLSVLLGLGVLLWSLFIFFGSPTATGGTVASIYFLYGSLAMYYGIKDLVTKER